MKEFWEIWMDDEIRLELDFKKYLKLKKLKKDIESITGMNIQAFIIDYTYFKEQLLKKEDNLIIHAVKTGFVLLGGYYFYKEVLK